MLFHQPGSIALLLDRKQAIEFRVSAQKHTAMRRSDIAWDIAYLCLEKNTMFQSEIPPVEGSALWQYYKIERSIIT